MSQEGKKVIFSGMQPSGDVTLGNYLGALKNWTNLQEEYNCLFCVVDMHSITVRQDPALLRKTSRDFLMQYIASGIDPKENIMFYQSHVPAHAELAWILNCYTYMGELNRMTQYKEKSTAHSENINAGLFTYPVLMAADILLYQADLVPVGDDQKQHLELARDIATRFNNANGQTFKVPEGYFGKVAARVMSLQDPTRKMSKSDEDQNSFVSILDCPDVIARKFRRAVTDSDNQVRFDDKEKPGISNLLSIYSAITGKTIEESEKDFQGKGYGDFKMGVAEVVIDELKPLQARYKELSQDKAYIDSIIKENAQTASYQASKTLRKVKRKVGFPDMIR